MPTKKSPIPTIKGPKYNKIDGTQPAFVSFTQQNEQKLSFATYNKAIQSVEPIYRTTGALATQYQGIDKNASIRSPFSRLDYEFFRPNEQIPRLQKQIIAACMTAYDKVGIVRNIIDLMGDFASQGIKLVHQNKSIERFYRSWFKQVKGKERSERFLNHLYRTGNVILKRNTAKLKDSHVEQFKKSIAADVNKSRQESPVSKNEPELNIDIFTPPPPGKKEIPWNYVFINPLMVDVVGEELAAFTGKNYYRIKLPQKVISMIQNPRDEFELGMVSAVPADILSAVNSDKKELKMGDDKLLLHFYKKDDWQIWANPMTYAILDDLVTLEKMKMADLAALDGAISHIRLWKLGNLEHKILPTDAAIQKLADLLLNNVGGGSMDLIWGPDLTIEETSTDIHKFLGNAKYESVLISIYAGLGIPPTLTGASPEGGGMTNNFISLRTLIERLRYGRDRLTEFWENEIKIVQKAMGFRQPAQITFDHMDLSDESSQMTLWTRLLEDNIISDETMREKLGLIPDIEGNRVKREWLARKDGKLPPKSGPYNDAEPDLSLLKIFAQRGSIAPSEAGVELKDKLPDQLTMVDLQLQQQQFKQQQMTDDKQDGVSGQGRPKGKKDEKKRKQKTVTPRTGKTHANDTEEFINLSLWGNRAQADITDTINPFFLSKFNRKTAREFTTAEAEEIERFKFVLLCNCEPFAKINAEYINKVVANPLVVYNDIDESLLNFKNKYISIKGCEPSFDEMRQMQSYVYAMLKGEYNNGDNYSDD